MALDRFCSFMKPFHTTITGNDDQLVLDGFFLLSFCVCDLFLSFVLRSFVLLILRTCCHLGARLVLKLTLLRMLSRL